MSLFERLVFQKMKYNFTLVTGLWDLGRGDLDDFKRPFKSYMDKFEELLSLDFNMYIYIPQELENFVNQRRSSINTRIVIRDLSDFKEWFDFFPEIDFIRSNPDWYNQTGQYGWLSKSPQARLEYYNPILMSRFFMLNDATIQNPFNSKYFFNIDGGLTNTVGLNQLKNLSRIEGYMESIGNKFLYLSYPYESDSEVHGFKSSKFNEYCGVEKTKYVCRGGFQGGTKSAINALNGEYYIALRDSLKEGYMGADENIHTIIAHKFSEKIHRFELSDNGLVYPFFNHLETITYCDTTSVNKIPYDKKKDIEDIKTSLYVLTYNSPSQFETLIKSYEENDPDFMRYPRKILVDNSTDPTNYLEYNRICKEHGFEHIKKTSNVGICGGRQFIAEHFNESDSEYYIFLEDDMTLHPPTNEICGVGLKRYESNLYMKSLAIIHKEKYDYLKLSFSEFFGNNETQWAWYNIPQVVRDEFFPDNSKLPENGLSDDAPKIIPTARKRYKSLNYLEGEYYYCNWPLWISQSGNRKIFLDTKWDRPYEQTWMSHVFQLQKKGYIKCGVLELSPIHHHRYDFYPAEERVES